MNQSEFLEAVFNHYGLDLPLGGEKSIHCPVHDDSRKSASVNSDKGVWVCYACQGSGSGIQIVMAKEKLTYPEARSWAEKNIGSEKREELATPLRSGRRTKGRWTPPRLRR
jgi:DNA primase